MVHTEVFNIFAFQELRYQIKYEEKLLNYQVYLL